MTSFAKSMPGWHDTRQRLMVISGRRALAKLLVVPHTTSSALGVLVLRRAAARAISVAQQDTPVFETADYVVRAAQVESVLWSSRTLDARAAECPAARAVPNGQPSLDE
jgi:hypothetical protein